MWAFDLVETTMKPLYDAAYGDDPDMEAEFGWKEKDKREELWSDHAWYLIARYQCQLILSGLAQRGIKLLLLFFLPGLRRAKL